MPLNQPAAARECAPSLAPSAAEGCESPLTIVRWSRKGASGVRMDESSKSVPSPAGFQWFTSAFIATPFGM